MLRKPAWPSEIWPAMPVRTLMLWAIRTLIRMNDHSCTVARLVYSARTPRAKSSSRTAHPSVNRVKVRRSMRAMSLLDLRRFRAAEDAVGAQHEHHHEDSKRHGVAVGRRDEAAGELLRHAECDAPQQGADDAAHAADHGRDEAQDDQVEAELRVSCPR